MAARLIQLTLAGVLLASGGARAARAQAMAGEVTANSEAERYLRVLQMVGGVPVHPWSVRGFTPRELDRLIPADSGHPWRDRLSGGGARVALLRPAAGVVYHSGFPVPAADGPQWAGRGATLAGSAGLRARFGALSLRVEPIVFWSQNRDFALMANGESGDGVFRDGSAPRRIDYPQRFGDEPFLRVDPGESALRLDVGVLAAELATGGQQWGPAWDQPLILGTSAGGFPHASLGSSRPVDVGLGRAHGRLVWGSLAQSAYSTVPEDSAGRFMAGMVGVLQPRGLPGLELGIARFFHVPLRGRDVRLRDFLRPVEAFYKRDVQPDEEADDGGENQIASLFARWVFPRTGAEVYAEYAKDDHNWDLLDFIIEPDHAASYTLGAARAWRGASSILVLRGEVLNAQPSHLQTVRSQGQLYRHRDVRAGHTQRGQLLGSAAGLGGGGSVLALERYTSAGRWTVDWTRTRVRDNWTSADSTEERRTDVIHSLGVEGLLFAGGVDLRAGVRASYELNRNLAEDAFDLGGTLSMRIGLGGRRPAAAAAAPPRGVTPPEGLAPPGGLF